jgi:hypothetical protein
MSVGYSSCKSDEKSGLPTKFVIGEPEETRHFTSPNIIYGNNIKTKFLNNFIRMWSNFTWDTNQLLSFTKIIVILMFSLKNKNSYAANRFN